MNRCTAKAKATGEQCRRAALNGSTVCIMHGARAPQVRRAAERNVQSEKLDKTLAKYAKPRDDVTPSVALIEELRRASGLVSWLEDRLRSADQPLGSVEWERLGAERDRLSRLATDLARLGVEQSMLEVQTKQIRRAEQQRAATVSALLVGAVLRRLGVGVDVGADVSGQQRRLANELLLDTIRAYTERPTERPTEALVLPAAVQSAVDERAAELSAERDKALVRVEELEAEVEVLRARVARDGVRGRLALTAGPEPVDPLEVAEAVADEAMSEPPVVLVPVEVISPPPRGQSLRRHHEWARSQPGFER